MKFGKSGVAPDFFEPIVQAQIGYKFKSRSLLPQAFTNKSYTEENGGESNEILKIIGEDALRVVVTKRLMEKYGSEKWYNGKLLTEDFFRGEYTCRINAEEICLKKEHIVSPDILAKRVDEQGFTQFLRRGKSETSNDPGLADKAAVLKSIIGAVAVDCAWNFIEIEGVIEVLIDHEIILDDSETNYIRLVQELSETKSNDIPVYFLRSIGDLKETGDNFLADMDIHNSMKYSCDVKLPDGNLFRGYGTTRYNAKMAVCKIAIEFYKQNGEYAQLYVY